MEQVVLDRWKLDLWDELAIVFVFCIGLGFQNRVYQANGISVPNLDNDSLSEALVSR